MSATWASGWVTGDIVTAAEFRKGMGCVADQTLGVAAASISVTLPAGYAHVLITAELRGDTAATSVGTVARFNADTGANYNYVTQIMGTVVSSAGAAAQTSMDPFGVKCPAASAAASSFGTMEIFIANYAGTTAHKQVRGLGTVDLDATTGNMMVLPMSARWKSTAAVTAFSIAPSSGNFIIGSRLSVYVMGS